MEWAWAAATADTAYDGAVLELEYLAPKRRCRDCGTESDGEPFEACPACDSEFTVPFGGDELLLVSLDVDDSPVDERAEKLRRDPGEKLESTGSPDFEGSNSGREGDPRCASRSSRMY